MPCELNGPDTHGPCGVCAGCRADFGGRAWSRLNSASRKDAALAAYERVVELQRIRIEAAESEVARALTLIREHCGQNSSTLDDALRQLIQGYIAERDNAIALQVEVARLRADAERLVDAGNSLLNAMETCHICQGTLSLDDIEPAHCEDCSGDCDSHDEPDCTPIYVLHRDLRAAIDAAREVGRD